MRIAFVKSHVPIRWQSCLFIFDNLDASYRLLAPDRLNLTSSPNRAENLESIQKIRDYGANTIVFSDYIAANFTELVEAITTEFAADKEKPTLLFHLYGNFSIEPNTWLRLNRALKHFPCKFLCASERQSSFVRSFMHPSAFLSVETCPFPVDTKKFYFDRKVRSRIRKRMGWQNDFVVLYTGRITPQKNVIPMLEELCENFLKRGKKLRIVLAGSFDTMSAPLFRGGEKQGFFYQREYLDFLESLSPTQQKRIQYLGHKTHAELFEIYNGADIFACWSTYHDEDFGMAPAEALACGLPSLLSSWGGFADFAMAHCRLTPVAITKQGIEINTAQFRKDLRFYFKNQKTLSSKRAHFSRQFSNKFSPLAVKRKLKQLLEQPAFPFPGFTAKVERHARLMGLDLEGAIYREPSCKDPYYFLNYSHYTGQNHGN